jgi:hypothetical protein
MNQEIKTTGKQRIEKRYARKKLQKRIVWSCVSFTVFLIISPILFPSFYNNYNNSLYKNKPQKVETSEDVNKESTTGYDNTESSSSSVSAFCSTHGEYFPSKYTNEYGEVKTTGCEECLYNDVNEELNEQGGFRDRVSHF